VIIVEVESELIDYEVGENGLIELSRMTLAPKDLVSRLIEDRKEAD